VVGLFVKQVDLFAAFSSELAERTGQQRAAAYTVRLVPQPPDLHILGHSAGKSRLRIVRTRSRQ